jgi:hypothetical protein
MPPSFSFRQSLWTAFGAFCGLLVLSSLNEYYQYLSDDDFFPHCPFWCTRDHTIRLDRRSNVTTSQCRHGPSRRWSRVASFYLHCRIHLSSMVATRNGTGRRHCDRGKACTYASTCRSSRGAICIWKVQLCLLCVGGFVFGHFDHRSDGGQQYEHP